MLIPASAGHRLVCVVFAAAFSAPSGLARQAGEVFAASGVEIRVDTWSTEADRADLVAIMKGKKDTYRGNDKLLARVQQMSVVGHIGPADGRKTWGWYLRLAFQSPLEDGGRRIVLVTNRTTTVANARTDAGRDADYYFIVIELRLDKSGRGAGKMNQRARLLLDKDDHFVLENYDGLPVEYPEIHKVAAITDFRLKPEATKPTLETGNWKLEAGSWKLEAGSWQLAATARLPLT